jgi:hypothetical protein
MSKGKNHMSKYEIGGPADEAVSLSSDDVRDVAVYLCHGFDLLGVSVLSDSVLRFSVDDSMHQAFAVMRALPEEYNRVSTMIRWTAENYETEASKALNGAPQYRGGVLAEFSEADIRAGYSALREAAARAPWGDGSDDTLSDEDMWSKIAELSKDTQDGDGTV